MLSWLVVLCPALCVSGLSIQVLRYINQALGQIEPIDITVLGQRIAAINLLETLRLSSFAQLIRQLTDHLLLTFTVLIVLIVLAGALTLIIIALLFSTGYNLLASIHGGLEVEVCERSQRWDTEQKL